MRCSAAARLRPACVETVPNDRPDLLLIAGGQVDAAGPGRSDGGPVPGVGPRPSTTAGQTPLTMMSVPADIHYMQMKLILQGLRTQTHHDALRRILSLPAAERAILSVAYLNSGGVDAVADALGTSRRASASSPASETASRPPRA